jgi:TonB family protein
MLVRLGAMRAIGTVLLVAMPGGACRGRAEEPRAGVEQPGLAQRPDEPPVMTNKAPPFRYPAPLYAQKVQGNVTLRLFIDRDGRPVRDSTRVEESSGLGSLDSAAISGSQDLTFIPAKLHGEPMGVVVLFPVYFRHPEAAPLPGDTVLGPTRVERGPSRP